MRVWLVTVGESLPTDGACERLLRVGILANMLADKGHEVVWWTSTFDHVRKRHRAIRDADVRLDNGMLIRMLYGCGYRSNISPRRLLDHVLVARRFARLAANNSRPDVILCSLPTLELSVAATRYGKTHCVPVVIDVRDLWPDLFEEIVPSWLRPLFRLFLAPMRRQAVSACQAATAITGNAPEMVGWGLKHAGRSPGLFDRYFPFGYVTKPLDEARRTKAVEFWAGHGIVSAATYFTACFFGAFSSHFEIETVIDAARTLERDGRKIRIVLCGAGKKTDELKARAAGLASVIFPGWVGAAEIRTLMEMSSIGLAPYISHVGFVGNLPNKPIEYLSAGLPVVSTLQGYLSTFLEEQGCGVTCRNGDVDGFARTLAVLADNHAHRHELSANARRVFEENFKAERVYGRMIGYLSDVAEKAHSPMKKL